ncbi:MAG: AMP-binding protein, partial [Actinobacteria bacterium]|nr:AMP-binding protein [Actinomycetota bacterium]
HPDCIGVPIPGGSFDIVPVDGLHADADADGELVYRGPNVMMGYAHRPADLALGATVDVLHTGDLARRTSEGLYQVVGRRSRFVKLFGLRIDLDQVEEALRNVGVEAACVGDDDRIVVAFEAGDDPDLVRATIRDRVGLPASVVVPVAGVVPRRANGKPDYAALTALLREPVVAEPERAPRTPAELFAAVLGLRADDVADHDTFVSLGGDSLTYVEISVALEELLGRLPADWHVTPVGRLTAASAAPPTVRRATSGMEANVVVRAVAIVLVVGTHADLFSWEGGAHALLAVAGFNFARFQLASGRMWRSIARVVVPSVACIGVLAAVGTTFDWRHALLVNGFAWEPVRPAFWYIEALLQLLVVFAVVFSVPWVRRVERAHRLAFAVGVLALGLLVRFDVPGMPFVTHPVRRAHLLLWLFAVGWLAALVSSSVQRVALSGVAAVAVVGFFGDGAREGLVLAGMLVLVWVPWVAVPRPLGRVVAAVAGASLYIYLTHWAVYPRLLDHVPPLVATVGALAFGVAVWTVVQHLPLRSVRSWGRWSGPTPHTSQVRLRTR